MAAEVCTLALLRHIEMARSRNASECTDSTECNRQYPIPLVDCSAFPSLRKSSASSASLTLEALREAQHTSAMVSLYEQASQSCKGHDGRDRPQLHHLDHGGWCLVGPPKPGFSARCTGRRSFADGALTKCFMNVSATATAGSSRYYWLPRNHYWPDMRMVVLLRDLLWPSGDGGVRYSLADIGAGVGQMCTALQAEDRDLSCASYDGAGNVEDITSSYVRWIDLTVPLALPRADWVVSFEVGEHVPNQFEPMLIRNLHATNCRGIVLSWGTYTPGKSGQGDANYHTHAYLIDTLSKLGYRHLEDVAPSYLKTKGQTVRFPISDKVYSISPAHFWFDNNLVGVFERVNPLKAKGCTREGAHSRVGGVQASR